MIQNLNSPRNNSSFWSEILNDANYVKVCQLHLPSSKIIAFIQQLLLRNCPYNLPIKTCLTCRPVSVATYLRCRSRTTHGRCMELWDEKIPKYRVQVSCVRISQAKCVQVIFPVNIKLINFRSPELLSVFFCCCVLYMYLLWYNYYSC